MDEQLVAPAEAVRPIAHGELIENLVDESKARTWRNGVEHLALKLSTGQRLLVRGGRDGIQFQMQGEREARTLHMMINGQLVQVVRIDGHTHPRVTGPSEGDLEALAILGQNRSYLFEIGGDRRGTRIRPKATPPAGSP